MTLAVTGYLPGHLPEYTLGLHRVPTPEYNFGGTWVPTGVYLWGYPGAYPSMTSGYPGTYPIMTLGVPGCLPEYNSRSNRVPTRARPWGYPGTYTSMAKQNGLVPEGRGKYTLLLVLGTAFIATT